MSQTYLCYNSWMVVHLMFCYLVGPPSFVHQVSLSAISIWLFPYQTSDNSIALDYPKTITSDVIYGNPFTMCYLLVARLYSHSLYPPTLNKPFSSMYRSRLCMPPVLSNNFISPVVPSLSWSLSILKACCWCNLIILCCAYSRSDTSRLVGDNALVVQCDGWCLALEISICLDFSIQATVLFILAQSEIKDWVFL